MSEIFGWIATINLLYAAWLVGNKQRMGFIVSLLGQSIFIIHGLKLGSPSLAFTSFVFAIMAIVNYYRWGNDGRTQKAIHQPGH